MPKILIVHPEGNIKNNPNLFAIAKLIVEKGWEVLVYSKRRPDIYQGDIFKGANFVYFETSYAKIFKTERNFLKEDIRCVIGIDNYGIYKAQKIASFLQIPYLFLSYEILFDEELKIYGNRFDCHYKKKAKLAAQGAVCSIAQDDVRRQIISKEYCVPVESVLYMPVANTGSHLLPASNYLHDALNIPINKKILLYMGWMNEIQEKRLIEFAPYLPENWVLVAHSRYKYVPRLNSPYVGQKIFFSVDKPVDNVDDMGVLLSDCQAGFCTYQPRYGNVYEGLNIKYIGLSSGKATTFLQYAVPIVVENMNIWDEIVKESDFGFELKSSESLALLDQIASNDAKLTAIHYFNSHLDARLYFDPIWDQIEKNERSSKFSRLQYAHYVLSHYSYSKCEDIRTTLRELLKNKNQ